MVRLPKRVGGLLAAVAVMALLLGACGSSAAPPSAAAPTSASGAAAPAAAGADQQMIEASKNEKDGLLVYSIMSENNWKPVLEGFNAKYSWIKVTTTDLGAYEVFERYYTEAAGNARTADFIATTAPDGWINFIKKGEVDPYVSAEDANIPAMGKIDKGVYAVSTDPMVFVWNKALLPEPPKTMAELVSMIQADPAKFNGKLATYDAAGEGFGYGLNWFYTKAKGDEGWKSLEALGSAKPRIQTSGGKIIDSVLSGEAMLGYFVSNITVQPRLAQAGQLLGYSFVPDAQVVAVRPMGVTKKAASPNSAKLLLDYILSAEGQLAFAKGGLTAYRTDVAEQAPLHLAQVSKAVGGDDKLIFVRPEAEIADQVKHDEFIARWQKALQIEP
ncbi:MAG TPA: extracellular solute-binding protein [Roseiflexaceae bacterium]|nr:extracellular solute-binding protein [Roseiflexaceae bacterium]